MSHYDNIGFTGITDSQSLVNTVKRVAPQAQEIGRFRAYRDPSGAELWIGTAEEGGVYAVEPYFAGCLQRVWVTSVQAGEYGNGTGFAQVWQNGTEAEDGECTDGDYPFIMDIPDLAAFPESTIGTVQTVKVCAFAQSAECFADQAAYEASQPDEEPKWAEQCFIPSGMFTDNAERPRPLAIALFAGFVRRAEKRVNSFTGSPFYYCEIDTYGGIWSAVYPIETFECTPEIGSIIYGEYWITGRLADAPEPSPPTAEKRRFWQKNARQINVN